MEKEKQNNEQIDKSKLYHFTDSILRNLWDILWNPDEDLSLRIDSIFNRALNLIRKSDLTNPEIQKSIFDQIVYFLNWLFKKVEIKKFYNNIPKTDIKNYERQSLWKEFIHNVYWKEWKLFYRDEIEGCDCSYWAVMFKHLFDKLKEMWMDIESDIFYYNNAERWHSWVVVSFQDSDYLIDINWFNAVCWNFVMQKIEALNDYSESKNFDVFSRKNIKKYYRIHSDNKWQKPKNDVCMLYNSAEDFIWEWCKKDHRSATIEFNPNITWKSENLKIVFISDKFQISIDWVCYTFPVDKQLITKLSNIPDDKILDTIISFMDYKLINENKKYKKVLITKYEKSLLAKYLNLIRSKIKISELRKIYWC